MPGILVSKYLSQLQQAYYGGNWLDENIEKKLKPVNEENAFIKPTSSIHSIAEVVSHVVEWRKELLQRFVTGGPARLRMESRENWLSNEVLKGRGWSYLKSQLLETQQEIVHFFETKDDAFLSESWSGDETYGWLLTGLIEHDIYHLGQIGLIYKMISADNYKSQPGSV